jgi:hypothetical protein
MTASVLPFHPVAPADEPDPVQIFDDGPLSVWHTPGSEPVVCFDIGGDVSATHDLSPDAVRRLGAALLLTRVGVPRKGAPVEIVQRLPGNRPNGETR